MEELGYLLDFIRAELLVDDRPYHVVALHGAVEECVRGKVERRTGNVNWISAAKNPSADPRAFHIGRLPHAR